MIEKSVKKQRQPPWTNKEIKEMRKEREKQFTRARSSSLPEDWYRYKHANCKTANLIKKAERNCFCESIDCNKGNTKGIWRSLKQLSGTDKPLPNISELKTDSGSITDADKIAESMNNFFLCFVSSLNKSNSVQSNHDKRNYFVSSRIQPGTSLMISLLSLKECYWS